MRSLYAKLSVVLLVLLLLLGAAVLAITLTTSHRYVEEVEQKLNLDLAEHILADQLPMEGGKIQQEALDHIFHMLMVINPRIEVYLLDPQGKILAFSAPPGHVVRTEVSLAPVETLLSGEARLPLYGDDPRDLQGRKVFSVAPIREDGRLAGYLYIILAGEKHDSAAAMVAGSTNLKLAAWTVGGSLLLALVGGLLAFGGLTRRLRALAANVAAFQRDELVAGAAVASLPGERGDEISRLARAFHEMAERIRRQIEELKETDRLRRELVANVSHDLRTPLTHLQGYLETLQLKEDALPAKERREYLAIAAQQSERLGRLVDDLFELAKLDASQDLPDREVFAVSELVQDVTQKFRLPAVQKGVKLEADIAGGPGPVSADLGLIERVLENLVENALRYTPDGGRVTVSVRPRSEGVLLEVSDTGSGIPASQLPHIFDRFHRYAPPGGRGAGGAGLGLAIARRALELHGSDLGCESAPGSGTTFRFLLPGPAA